MIRRQLQDVIEARMFAGKAIIVIGARQVGKTWILEEFGKEFADGFVRINFDKEPEYNQFFEKSKDVKRIIQNLSFACSKKITTNTLIIFDEKLSTKLSTCVDKFVIFQ